MLSTRRDFLKTTAMLSVLAAGGTVARMLSAQAFAAAMPMDGQEYILLTDTDAAMTPHGYTDHPGRLKALHVMSGEVTSVELPIYGHLANQLPATPEQVITFTKWGRRGAVVDLKQKKLVAELEATPGNVFLGHCAFDPTGTLIVATEGNTDSTNGLIVMRDTATLAVTASYDSYGIKPHECRSPDGGKTLMVVNSGNLTQSSNMAWIDLKSGELLQEVKLATDETLYVHFDIAFDGWVCTTGAILDDDDDLPTKRVAFIAPNGNVFSPIMPKDIVQRIRGEILSIAFLGHSGLVAVTVPDSRMLLVFDYKKNKLVDVVPDIHVKGVLPSLTVAEERGVIISVPNSKSSLAEITVPKTGHATRASMPIGFGGNGSHLTRIYI